MSQNGLSPKIALPVALTILAGAALLIAGFLIPGAGQLVTIGVAVFGTSGVHGLIGYHAPAGDVTVDRPAVGSDEQLLAAVPDEHKHHFTG